MVGKGGGEVIEVEKELESAKGVLKIEFSNLDICYL
jgi:hypothetical protein